MSENSFDLVVIGAGPGGYVCAIRAAQLGLKVACIEKEFIGGTCLNVGCIPSKALLESSELYSQAKENFKDHGIGIENLALDIKQFMARKDKVVKQLTGGVAMLFKKNKITSLMGEATLNAGKSITIKGKEGSQTVTGKSVVIATGSVPVNIPSFPFDGKRIIDSTGALSLSEVPKSLIIVGGGIIGLELGSVYLRLGTQVTVLEAFDRIAPSMDTETGTAFQKILTKQGMKFSLKAKVVSAKADAKAVSVVVEDETGKTQTLTSDYLLVSVGRKPYTQGLGLESVGIKPDAKGRIPVTANFETQADGVYAIGDVIAGPMLAHKAMEEGVAVAQIIAGKKGHINYNLIPSVIYTWPEVAWVGLTEEQAKAAGLNYKAFKFPFLAIGRAIAAGEKDGFIKMLADKNTDRILGAHILGPRASEMISELVVAMEFGAKASDLANISHAHPTLTEGIKEAALGLTTGTIHL
jgi:dihydrolipoamide dehydrogenase